MTFTRRKKAPEGAAKPAVKMHVVSVRLNDEQYQTVVENCRLSGRKLSDYWRRALLNAKVTAIATPEDMAILRQLGGMANNLNQLAKRVPAASQQQGQTLVRTHFIVLFSERRRPNDRRFYGETRT